MWETDKTALWCFKIGNLRISTDLYLPAANTIALDGSIRNPVK